MATIQQRINELLIYSQLNPGDAEYIDPATVYLAVDKTGWSKPKKMSLVDFITSNHVETSSTAPTSASFSLSYNDAFVDSGYYFNLYVYKVITIPGVGDVEQTVKYHDLAKTVNGFSFTLDTYEAGIIVRYLAFESSLNTALNKDYVYATGSVASLVVPDSDKVQITGLTSIINKGITLASNEFTVTRTGIYEISFGCSMLNETASNLISLDVYSDVPAALGITKNFVPRNDYDTLFVSGLLSLTAADVVRFYLSAPATGLTIDLSTITVNIKQV